MKCPVCSEPMERRELQPRRFYWRCFDHGVLVHIGFFRWFKGAAHIGIGLESARSATIPVDAQKALTCPQCRTKMITTPAKPGSPLQVDQCLKCGNVWFDVGEIERLKSKGELETEFPTVVLKSDTLGEGAVYFKGTGHTEGIVEVSDSQNPFVYLGLPVEEDRYGVRRFPQMTAILLLAMIATTIRGLKSPTFMREYLFYPEHPFLHKGMNLFIATLMHGSWWHLFGNGYALFVVGDNIEELDGPLTLCKIFWIGALAGWGLSAWMGMSNPTLGASGGIAGLMVYYVLMFPKNRFHFGFFQRFGFSAISISGGALLGLWLLTQIVGFQSQQLGRGEGVNYFAHIAGAITGLLFYIHRRPQLNS